MLNQPLGNQSFKHNPQLNLDERKTSGAVLQNLHRPGLFLRQ